MEKILIKMNKAIFFSGFKTVTLAVLLTLMYSCNTSSNKIDFSSQIKPILNKKCIICHGGVKKWRVKLTFQRRRFCWHRIWKTHYYTR